VNGYEKAFEHEDIEREGQPFQVAIYENDIYVSICREQSKGLCLRQFNVDEFIANNEQVQIDDDYSWCICKSKRPHEIIFYNTTGKAMRVSLTEQGMKSTDIEYDAHTYPIRPCSLQEIPDDIVGRLISRMGQEEDSNTIVIRSRDLVALQSSNIVSSNMITFLDPSHFTVAELGKKIHLYSIDDLNNTVTLVNGSSIDEAGRTNWPNNIEGEQGFSVRLPDSKSYLDFVDIDRAIHVKEYKMNSENQLEVIQHLRMTALSSIAHATVDETQKYLIMISGKGARENFLDNSLYIWELAGRKGQVAGGKGGMLLHDKYELGDDRVYSMGVVQTEQQDKAGDKRTSQFIWMLARCGENDEHAFILYSILDHRIIYRHAFEPRTKVSHVIFDQLRNIVYMVDRQGITRSNVLWQRQNEAASLLNYINFSDFEDDAPFEHFAGCMGRFTSFPQMQNLVHLFAIADLGEQIDEALQDENLFYFRDFMGRTPLQIAMDSQNETAWTTIINSCEYSDKVFMTISDVLQLIPETAPLVTLAFDTLFHASEFLDNSSNLHKGLLKASRGDWFGGAEEEDRIIFFTTAGKYLTYRQS